MHRRILGSTLEGTNIPNVRLTAEVAYAFVVLKQLFSVENYSCQLNRGVNLQMKQVVEAADVLDAFSDYIRMD